MTPDEFRAVALGLPDVVESAHMDHPDFRVGGKIFASLGYPSVEFAMVSLTAGDQARFSTEEPDVFVPLNNAWGRAGATQVNLGAARDGNVRAALRAAWENRVQKNSSGGSKKGTKETARKKTTRV